MIPKKQSLQFLHCNKEAEDGIFNSKIHDSADSDCKVSLSRSWSSRLKSPEKEEHPAGHAAEILFCRQLESAAASANLLLIHWNGSLCQREYFITNPSWTGNQKDDKEDE